jgi:SAM-dependent methyltransferase
MAVALKASVPPRYKRAGRRAFLRLVGIANAGSRVECPCCSRRYRQFARFHGEHDQCPGCGALMRHRALFLLLRDRLAIESSGRDVVHFAPSSGVDDWLRSLANGNYVSADLDPAAADVPADITDLPFEDESFDLALCLHVLEHVPDDRAAIRELARVLRPGGTAVVQVPPSELRETFEDFTVTTPTERARVFGQHDHVRICGADYGRRLEEAGFLVEELDYVERVDPGRRARYGLRTGEPFHVCTKPAAQRRA